MVNYEHLATKCPGALPPMPYRYPKQRGDRPAPPGTPLICRAEPETFAGRFDSSPQWRSPSTIRQLFVGYKDNSEKCQ